MAVFGLEQLGNHSLEISVRQIRPVPHPSAFREWRPYRDSARISTHRVDEGRVSFVE
jgi:hypothetical protein